MMDAAFFQKIFLFQDLEEGEIHQVLEHTSLREFSAEEVIIQEGEPGDSLFIMPPGKWRSPSSSPWCWMKTPPKSG